MHRASPRFWFLDRLPEAVQRISRQNFELLKENSSHPSLHFKKIGKLWSVRVGLNHRALAVEDDGDYIGSGLGPMTSTFVRSNARLEVKHRYLGARNLAGSIREAAESSKA